MERAKEWISENIGGTEQVDELLSNLKVQRAAVMEQAHQAASFASEQVEEAKGVANVAFEHYRQAEAVVFDHLKAGVYWALAHPGMTTVSAGAAVLLLARGPRRLLLRNTVGRFRSEEAMLSRAEARMEGLRQNVQQLRQERLKLEERAGLAEGEYKRGLQKLTATGLQLRRLAKNGYGVEGLGSSLREDLRELPGRQAIKMRGEVAELVAEAHKHRASLDKKVVGLVKLGIPL